MIDLIKTTDQMKQRVDMVKITHIGQLVTGGSERPWKRIDVVFEQLVEDDMGEVHTSTLCTQAWGRRAEQVMEQFLQVGDIVTIVYKTTSSRGTGEYADRWNTNCSLISFKKLADSQSQAGGFQGNAPAAFTAPTAQYGAPTQPAAQPMQPQGEVAQPAPQSDGLPF